VILINVLIPCRCCPFGCQIEVTSEDGVIYQIEGNNCLKGDRYAEQESGIEYRILTFSVRVRNGKYANVRGITSKAFEIGLRNKVISQLKEIELEAPIYKGDILAGNLLGTGISLVAITDLPEK
jgi:CxxC motif-containing protein